MLYVCVYCLVLKMYSTRTLYFINLAINLPELLDLPAALQNPLNRIT